MNLCPKCDRPLWPFAMILTITSVIAFLTWLILGLSPIEPWQRLLVTLIAFIAVGATLLNYVISCLKRHCRHDHPVVQGRS